MPGAWVYAPYTGALWTPGYWGWNNGFYVWNGGYWGLHIGFYGGVDYGYGYYGHGYEGGYWNHGAFTYNRTINHIDSHVHNVYERNVGHDPDNRISFNGGDHGIHAEASPQERIAEHEQHISAVPLQQQHQKAAMGNRAQFANVNHGNPAVAATQRPGAQAFHQALAHPNNPQAIQAARTAPNTHNGGQNNGQSNARPAPANLTHSPEQAHPQPQQQAVPAHNFGAIQPHPAIAGTPCGTGATGSSRSACPTGSPAAAAVPPAAAGPAASAGDGSSRSTCPAGSPAGSASSGSSHGRRRRCPPRWWSRRRWR